MVKVLSKRARKILYVILAAIMLPNAGSYLFSQNNPLPNGGAVQSENREQFTPEQDSAFARAIRWRLPLNTRMAYDLAMTNSRWEFQQKISEGTPWQFAMRNMQNIPREAYIPDPKEMVQFQTNIAMSQYIPFVRNTMPYGLQVPLSSIGQLMGLTEDVSPKLKYNLDYTSEIEVVIYSERAVVVATLFKGIQTPGSYSITWNFRDDQGREMPSGDYIGEIRVGKERYMRKHIVIP